MEPISYQVTIETDGTERVVEEFLVKAEENDQMPGEEEFESILTSIRSQLADKGIVGKLSLYELERELKASVESATPPPPPSALVLP